MERPSPPRSANGRFRKKAEVFEVKQQKARPELFGSSPAFGITLTPGLVPAYTPGAHIPDPPTASDAGSTHSPFRLRKLGSESVQELMRSDGKGCWFLNQHQTQGDLSTAIPEVLCRPLKSLEAIRCKGEVSTWTELVRLVTQHLNMVLRTCVDNLSPETQSELENHPFCLNPNLWIGRAWIPKVSGANNLEVKQEETCLTVQHRKGITLICGRGNGGGRRKGQDKTAGNARPRGYPYIRLHKNMESVQRLLLWAVHGPPDKKLNGPCVMHTCGNSLCCSLEHISWGTAAWNNRDRKGRV
jgi:hypothetical protein